MDVNKLVVGQKYKSTAKHGQRVTLIEICNDKLMWNYGVTSIVIAIVNETKSQIVIEEQYESGTYQRRLGKNRLVAIAE